MSVATPLSMPNTTTAAAKAVLLALAAFGAVAAVVATLPAARSVGCAPGTTPCPSYDQIACCAHDEICHRSYHYGRCCAAELDHCSSGASHSVGGGACFNGTLSACCRSGIYWALCDIANETCCGDGPEIGCCQIATD